jgi:hypothetical protein
LADGVTLVTDFTQPIHVAPGDTVRIYATATDDVDQSIPESWVKLSNGARLADGTLASDGTYYFDLNVSLLQAGAASTIVGQFKDSEGNIGSTA